MPEAKYNYFLRKNVHVHAREKEIREGGRVVIVKKEQR